MNPTLAVARLHLVGWRRDIGWPWAIATLSFVVNLALFMVIGAAPGEQFITGGLSTLYIFVLVVNIQAITRLFPFAMALSTTRTTFYLGSCLTAAGQAVCYSVILTGLLAIERGTDGWGVALQFLGVPYLVQGDPVSQVIAYAGPFLFAASVGLACGAVYQRWHSTGMFTALLGTVVVMGAIGWWITWTGNWTALGHWLRDQPALGLMGGWTTLLAVLVAGAGFAVLRRTPA